MFRGIASKSFPPFGEFRLLLPPVPDKPAELAEVHLLTGVNGTGKTRLLALLAAMMGHDEPLRRRLKGTSRPIEFRVTDRSPLDAVGGSTRWAPWFEAHEKHSQWRVHPGHGTTPTAVPAFAYSGTAYVSDAAIGVLADTPRPDRGECLSFERPETHSKQLLQAIANLKVEAAMHKGESQAGQVVAAMEDAITGITGTPFTFHVTTRPKAMLSVRWPDNELPLDLLPDGLRSIIGWLVHALVMMDAWLQGKGTPMETEAVFLLDEVESHLHPAWQRRILPAFQRLFPKAQIIVATHSPFVISSLNHGWIHPITLGRDGRALIQDPVAASEGDSYVSVLEDIMGIKEWYDTETESLLREFREQREAAYAGDDEARSKAEDLADKISRRSQELGFMMGRELSQMERQLAVEPVVQ